MEKETNVVGFKVQVLKDEDGIIVNHIQFACDSMERMLNLKECIHNSLVGNKAYIDCDIVLNGSDNDQQENDISPYVVNLYVTNDAVETLPVEIDNIFKEYFKDIELLKHFSNAFN